MCNCHTVFEAQSLPVPRLTAATVIFGHERGYESLTWACLYMSSDQGVLFQIKLLNQMSACVTCDCMTPEMLERFINWCQPEYEHVNVASCSRLRQTSKAHFPGLCTLGADLHLFTWTPITLELRMSCVQIPRWRGNLNLPILYFMQSV